MNIDTFDRSKIIQDNSNNPSLVQFSNPKPTGLDEGGLQAQNLLTLPYDVMISIDGEKIIAESQILDGEAVFERVSRKPREIVFDFTFREIGVVQTTKGFFNDYIFPQNSLVELNSWWEVNGILKVYNTLLNKLGITEIICLKHSINTIRGSVNVPVILPCKENYVPNQTAVGQTLIIQ